MRLVYLSPVPWSSFAQRPHKFVEWFHKKYGGDVYWIDPYPTRFPTLADISNRREAGLSQVVPSWMRVVAPKAVPIEPMVCSGIVNSWLWQNILNEVDMFISEDECVIGVGKPSELASRILRRSRGVASFYDAMDDFPAFYTGASKLAMRARESRIAAEVSRIFVSSSAIKDRFRHLGSKLCFVPNACSVELLPEVRAAVGTRGRPILGYVGTIGKWFDWQCIHAIAAACPEAIVRIIGPVYSRAKFALPNVEMLPACTHTEAIAAMSDFSVGLIPFIDNQLTKSVDPIKYYEYRSLGLPVITTRFGEMVKHGEQHGVFFFDTYCDVSAIVNDALSCSMPIGEIESFRRTNSWDFRFDSLSLL